MEKDDYTEYRVLYNLSTVPYLASKTFSTCKEFTNSFPAIEKEFVPTELKQWQAHLGSNQERQNQNLL
jgi:hypothetical protein